VKKIPGEVRMQEDSSRGMSKENSSRGSNREDSGQCRTEEGSSRGTRRADSRRGSSIGFSAETEIELVAIGVSPE
jgi:hypothetical protein